VFDTLYPWLRKPLFCLDPERAHDLTLSALRLTERTGLSRCLFKASTPLPAQHTPTAASPIHLMGLDFANPVGLAAGLDKDGVCIDGLAALGFGFLEIGTVTPKPQPGNPSPRLFRLPQAHALINRMGFNNEGVANLLHHVRAARFKGILGINIGKNANTPLEQAADDYLYGLEQVYRDASYITINISSPNTSGLRTLQEDNNLDALLHALTEKRARLADQYGKYTPLVVKISPDMNSDEIKALCATLLRHRLDGLIASNTTIDRAAVTGLPHAQEAGGVSGRPVFEKSNATIRQCYAELGDAIPIIGVGGIFSAADARAKIEAGAKLVQIYTGLIYQGPTLVNECIHALQPLQV
jgi:dihydroorotate dehydrogenase